MLKSFKDREAKKIFERETSLRLPQDIQRVALRKLLMLDASQHLQDLRVPPSNHLELLKGSGEKKYSIRVNDQWRIRFRWAQDSAYDVEIIDYH